LEAKCSILIMRKFNGTTMPTLPSTTGLRTFETSARLLNFTRAAEELNLTQGAISHQIRELEEVLGVRLFDRRHRGLALTEAGRIYLIHTREALESLRAGAEALGKRDAVLTVTVSPNFANKWLVPRLGNFSAAHPEIDLRISAARRHTDFATDDIDLAVRHGTGDWPHLHVQRLCPEEIFPVCGPGLLTPGALLERPGDLRRHTLLHDRDRTGWRQWLITFGVPADIADHGPVFSDTSLAIDAAVAGQGVALARSALAIHDLDGRRLVRPMTESVSAAFAYWIVCPKASANESKIAIFRDWLVAQAADTTAGRP
jgi:LysR family transcriptional regulator, glycine cleavage system transcriptional activator